MDEQWCSWCSKGSRKVRWQGATLLPPAAGVHVLDLLVERGGSDGAVGDREQAVITARWRVVTAYPEVRKRDLALLGEVELLDPRGWLLNSGVPTERSTRCRSSKASRGTRSQPSGGRPRRERYSRSRTTDASSQSAESPEHLRETPNDDQRCQPRRRRSPGLHPAPPTLTARAGPIHELPLTGRRAAGHRLFEARGCGESPGAGRRITGREWFP